MTRIFSFSESPERRVTTHESFVPLVFLKIPPLSPPTTHDSPNHPASLARMNPRGRSPGFPRRRARSRVCINHRVNPPPNTRWKYRARPTRISVVSTTAHANADAVDRPRRRRDGRHRARSARVRPRDRSSSMRRARARDRARTGGRGVETPRGRGDPATGAWDDIRVENVRCAVEWRAGRGRRAMVRMDGKTTEGSVGSKRRRARGRRDDGKKSVSTRRVRALGTRGRETSRATSTATGGRDLDEKGGIWSWRRFFVVARRLAPRPGVARGVGGGGAVSVVTRGGRWVPEGFATRDVGTESGAEIDDKSGFDVMEEWTRRRCIVLRRLIARNLVTDDDVTSNSTQDARDISARQRYETFTKPKVAAQTDMTAVKSRANRGNNNSSDAERKQAHAEATTKGQMRSASAEADAQNQMEGKRTPDNTVVSTLGKARPAPVSSSESDEEALMVQRAKKNWSADAVALGYEIGTIKHSAYVLLAESGTQGMTVASIVGTAQRLSMYSWGQCKTPNNSVTAALSQDETFVRIAPSTYCLRSQLRGSGENLPVPRTSSGSHDSGTTGMGNHGHVGHRDSGHSGPRGRSHKKQRVVPRAQSPMHFVVDEPNYSGYEDDDVVNIQVEDSVDRFDRVDDAKRTAEALARESYRRRMDVYGHSVGDEFGTSFHFASPQVVRPDHSPDGAVAGSCLLYYPTARASERTSVLDSPEEPSEATHRAEKWKHEAKRLHSSKHRSRVVSTLPTWVLEQYNERHNQILRDDL